MLKYILSFLFLTLCTFAENKPNVILIMADDLGYECLGANGSEYKTPNLDQLAANGARFTNCFANPICTPSRVKIMTGLYNVRNYKKFGTLPRTETTFAHQFQKAGYTTCIAGKWQLGQEKDAPQHFGFDEACLWQHTRGREKTGSKTDSRFENPQLEINGKEMNYNNGEFGPDLVSDFVCDFMEKNKDKPFMVYYPMILTHCPFVATPDSKEWNPKSPGSPTYKGDAKFFPDMTSYMDKIVGKIDNKLKELGLRENTLLIFTGDNGTDKPVKTQLNGKTIKAGKGTLTENGTRVPLVVSWPGKIKSGFVTDELVDFSDMMPTMLEAAGAALPERSVKTDGVSFLSTLTGMGNRDKPYVYMWWIGQSIARNKTHGVTMQKGKTSLLKYSGHYESKVVKEASTEADKTAFSKLQYVLDEYEKVRPKDLKIPKR